MVLAAPEVDLGQFKRIVIKITPFATRTTAYSSSGEKAVCLSGTLIGTKRTDVAASDLAGIPGLDSLDTNKVSENCVGHSSYWVYDPQAERRHFRRALRWCRRIGLDEA